jgi:hypothetical protein
MKLLLLVLFELIVSTWLVLYTGRHYSIWKFESRQIEAGAKTTIQVLGGRVKRSLAVFSLWILFGLCLIGGMLLL